MQINKNLKSYQMQFKVKEIFLIQSIFLALILLFCSDMKSILKKIYSHKSFFFFCILLRVVIISVVVVAITITDFIISSLKGMKV